MNSQILILSLLFNIGDSGVKEFSLNESATEFITEPAPKNDNADSKAALKDAVEFVNAIERDGEEPRDRFRLWKTIAGESFILGERDISRKAIASMEKATKELDQRSQCFFLPKIASEWGRHGEVAKVLEIHSKINDIESVQIELLIESAQNAIQSGYYEAAQQFANKLPMDYSRRNGIIQRLKVSEICHRAKKKEITEALLKEVDQLSDENQKACVFIGQSQMNGNIDKLNLSDGSFFEIAMANGNRKQAIAMVTNGEKAIEKNKGKNTYRYNLLALSRAYALLKDPQSIRKLLAVYPSAPAKDDPSPKNYEWSKVELKTMLAVAEVGAGNLDAANQIAIECNDKYDRAYILMYIGLALQKEGKTEKAKVSLGIARMLFALCISSTSDMYVDLAAAEAICGDYKAALSIASKVFPNPFGYVNVALAMCKAGQYEEARKVMVKNFKPEAWQGEFLMEIAERQAKAGQIQEVKKWIAEEDNPFRKAFATIGLAKGLYKEKSSAK